MLLILDEKPRNPLQRIPIETRTFLKEGLRLSWQSVFTPSKAGNNRTRPYELSRELHRRKIEFFHNDFTTRRQYEHAWVVTEPLALRWAIEQKKLGQIKVLIVGPLVAHLPYESGRIMESPEIDAIAFASPWVRDLYLKQCLTPPKRTYTWPAGVDEREWRPGLGKKDLTVVIDKHSGLLDATVSKLLQKNYKVEVLKHNQYSRRQFRDTLQKARFAVFLSPWQAQGISMFEAWSCDVPTIHWNPKRMSYHGKTYDSVSSCFYLTEKCGLEFSDPEDFSSILERFEWKYRNFSPRNFVLDGYTLRQSIDRFLHFLTLPSQDVPLQGLQVRA